MPSQEGIALSLDVWRMILENQDLINQDIESFLAKKIPPRDSMSIEEMQA
jgi:hypothetical protein